MVDFDLCHMLIPSWRGGTVQFHPQCGVSAAFSKTHHFETPLFSAVYKAVFVWNQLSFLTGALIGCAYAECKRPWTCMTVHSSLERGTLQHMLDLHNLLFWLFLAHSINTVLCSYQTEFKTFNLHKGDKWGSRATIRFCQTKAAQI